MSKFLKFIVHFVVICTMICVLGIALPPFFGVTTVVMDDPEKATNLPMGSVTYAIPVKTTEITPGAPILVQEDSKDYRYNVNSINLENGTGTVVNPASSDEELITVAVRDYVPRVVVTIGLVGYLMVATKSVEGMIIIGLVVLFLIILYVIAELWKKEPEQEEEEEDPAPGYVKSKKELKKEEKERARRMKEEEREIIQEEKLEKKNKKAARKGKKTEKKMVRTGGFVDEIEDDEEDEEGPSGPSSIQSAASEAHEVLKKEIAAATAEQPVKEDAKTIQKTKDIVGDVKKASEKMPAAEETDEIVPTEIGRLAIPLMTAAQIAEQAKAMGDAPEIVRDEITRVTMFDYSDIIGAEEEDTEE